MTSRTSANSKKPAWQACPAPKTSLQRLKYVKVCSDHLANTMKQDKKTDPQAHIPTVNAVLPAVLHCRSWKGKAESTTVTVAQVQEPLLADWGYSSRVSLSCASCKQPLQSSKLPRHTLVLPHYPRAFMPLCRECVKG